MGTETAYKGVALEQKKAYMLTFRVRLAQRIPTSLGTNSGRKLPLMC